MVLCWLPCSMEVLIGLFDSSTPGVMHHSDEFAFVNSIAGNYGKLGDGKDLVEICSTHNLPLKDRVLVMI